MIQPLERPAQEALSQTVIPAVPGEFYSYSSEFTDKKPLFVFMKCKANKAWMAADAERLGREANLFFLFNQTGRMEVRSISAAHAAGLLGDSIDAGSFGETWVAPAPVSAEDFYQLRSRADVADLVTTCKTACAERATSLHLEQGMVVAMMTDAGKYGMFLVKEVAATSIRIDACHILL